MTCLGSRPLDYAKQAHYPSSYSNGTKLATYPDFIAPSSAVAYSTRLEQLLKYRLKVWGAPKTKFTV